MKRIYLLVEGQTEEIFVREVLAPHYNRIELFMTPIGLGGIKRYGNMRSQVSRLCRQDRDAAVSTIIDLYGLPADFPGKSDATTLVLTDVKELAFGFCRPADGARPA